MKKQIMKLTHSSTTGTIQRTQLGTQNQIAKESGVWLFCSVLVEWWFLRMKTYKWNLSANTEQLHVPPLTMKTHSKLTSTKSIWIRPILRSHRPFEHYSPKTQTKVEGLSTQQHWTNWTWNQNEINRFSPLWKRWWWRGCNHRRFERTFKPTKSLKTKTKLLTMLTKLTSKS